jgi:ribonuclease HII
LLFKLKEVNQLPPRTRPSLKEEKELHRLGYPLVAGIDEVGRGALMGPVMAAAVIMPDKVKGKWKDTVRDSKQLTPPVREWLFEFIKEAAIAVGIGASSNEVIDEIGIVPATRRAMKEAIEQLDPPPQYLLIDYMNLPDVNMPQKGIVDGDSLCFSIACASIIAKVTRDRIVTEWDRDFPGYGFASHKGYGTEKHMECLRRKGPCPLHRRSFQPVRELFEGIV